MGFIGCLKKTFKKREVAFLSEKRQQCLLIRYDLKGILDKTRVAFRCFGSQIIKHF